MQAIIGAKLIASKAAQPGEKPFTIADTRLRGFTLRVQPSGVRSYYARWGRSGIQVIGKVGEFTPDEARERCQKILGNVAHGRPPLHGLDGAEGLTLGEFIEQTYSPWLKAHRPQTAEDTLGKIKRHFAAWNNRPLASLTAEDVEGWKVKRLSEGTAPTTVQRDVMALSGVLTRAVKAKQITENVVRGAESPKIDRTPKVRYLGSLGDPTEEKRLRDALRERD